MTEIQFKVAESSEEIEQIHRLNHRIFAEEIGQHEQTSDGLLVDKFHTRNRYFIAQRDGSIVGMVSVHAGPDFSIASRLQDKSILGRMRAPLEVRLLALLPEHRNRALLAGLLWQVFHYASAQRFSDLLISGIEERVPMYMKMGFHPIGPPVLDGAASFVPMRMSLDAPPDLLRMRAHLYQSRWNRNHSVSLMPGPVAISDAVTQAFHRTPVSHRSEPFLAIYEEARSRLSGLMPGMSTVILGGSGTLANDAVAANLRSAFGDREGLVLANGEFGERLIRQATRAGLSFRQARFSSGAPWSFNSIEQQLNSAPAWIWAVHLETSTGVLNDLPRLVALAGRAGIPVAADCVSSLGAVSTDFAGQHLLLATGVSGKALGSFAGLAFVFVSQDAAGRLQGARVCPTFDLVQAVRLRGPASTASSPLMLAVHQALRENYASPSDCAARFAHYQDLGCWARTQIRQAGLEPLAPEKIAAPTITTFPLPSRSFPRRCLDAGFQIAHESEYLRARSWGQIATMGNLDRRALLPFFDELSSLVHRQSLEPVAQ